MKRAFFAPEVLQSSGMDCGPAALKALCRGLGVHVNYEKLREACHTGADGTSIDALEDICLALGLDARQEMAPKAVAVDVLRAAAPAIVVVHGSGGAFHFVVLWRIVGPWAMLMDPTRGRRWVHVATLPSELREHTQPLDAETLRAWFPITEWGKLTDARLAQLGSAQRARDAASAEALATLEASCRLVHALDREKLLSRAGARELLQALAPDAEAPSLASSLPEGYRAISRRAHDGALVVTGCVFLRVRRDEAAAGAQPSALARRVLGAPDAPPWRALWAYVTVNARRMALGVALVSLCLALLTYVEMLFLRAAFNAGSLLSLPQQRLGGMLLYAAVVAALLALEYALATHVARLGRALELRCRHGLLAKLPRLPDRYFRTRPLSDITHRSQGLFMLRELPTLLVSIGKTALELLVTGLALLALHPSGAAYTLLALGFGLLLPVLTLRFRAQFEHRVQSHASALSQLYLDVLLGLSPIRTHGGQHSVRARQDEILADWYRESERTVLALGVTDAVQQIGTLLSVAGILFSFVRGGGEPGLLLVLCFWALKLPLQAKALSQTLQRTPPLLASLNRLIEPLTAEETRASDCSSAQRDRPENTAPGRAGVSLDVRGAKAVLGTHEVLAGLSVSVSPGEHVAVVGSSGAGKSSLLGAMLGFIELDAGDVCVDGVPMQSYGLARFRRETVWIDPSVQLWNRSLDENILFGNAGEAMGDLSGAIERAELGTLLERLEEGMATPLGESGARVSGGEGQRVRLARALARRSARLILLDEAFRGLDRRTRRRLSAHVRHGARETTVIEVTHDVADTLDFDRVLVVEDGVLIEEGKPAQLLADGASRFHALVQADREVQLFWDDPGWKRVIVGASPERAGSVASIERSLPARRGAAA